MMDINKKATEMVNEAQNTPPPLGGTLFQFAYRAAKAEMDVEDLKWKLSVGCRHEADLRHALRTADEEAEELRGQLEFLSDQHLASVNRLCGDVENLKRQNDAQREALTNFQKEGEKKDEQLAHLRKIITLLREDQQVQKAHELRAELAETSDLLAETRVTLHVKVAHIDGLEQMARESAVALRSCQNETDALLVEKRALEERIKDLQALLSDARVRYHDWKDAAEAAELALDNVRACHASQAATIVAYQGVVRGLKDLKSAMQDIDLDAAGLA